MDRISVQCAARTWATIDAVLTSAAQEAADDGEGGTPATSIRQSGRQQVPWVGDDRAWPPDDETFEVGLDGGQWRFVLDQLGRSAGISRQNLGGDSRAQIALDRVTMSISLATSGAGVGSLTRRETLEQVSRRAAQDPSKLGPRGDVSAVIESEEPGWADVVDTWRHVVAATTHVSIPGPATSRAVSDAETRLGIAMPKVLSDLYSVADGLPSLGGDVYGVRGSAELAWFRDAEADLIEIWDEINRDGGFLSDGLELMRTGLAVSKDGDEYRLLLVPTGTDADDWQLYRHSNGGDPVTPYPSLSANLLDMARAYCSDLWP